MAGFDSISSLLSKAPKDDDSIQGKFAEKQKEIHLKELEAIAEKKAAASDLPYINLVNFPISPEAIILIPQGEAVDKQIVCFFYDGENARLGTTEPENPKIQEVIAAVKSQYFVKTKLYYVSKTSLDYAMEIYKSVPKAKLYDSGVEIKEEDLERFKNEISNYRSLGEKINTVNTTEIVTLILATALRVGASDIHIEAEAKGVAVRLRIDGVLQEAALIDKTKWKKIISRMKILAGVKINVEDKPQDGRYSIFLTNDRIDVRSSFLPTAYGESVVMRLLRSSSIGLSFEQLGIMPEAFKILQEEVNKPNGLILTTGPTGSGKTTTLYAVLNKLNLPGTKIITLEDPIEYQLKGISQSQINASRGYTFADGLRSILRQDPNVVMVGEIRDLETAEISVQASLTGHLVLSTLHTNDAAGVIPRLIDMGIKPYFLVPSINAVIGQRLIRKVCTQCRVVHELTEDEATQVKKILAVISPKSGVNVPTTLPVIYKAGAGCELCNGLGYKGRIGIYEIFTLDEKLKQLTIDNAPTFKILQQAIENGMVTMLQDGVLKVLAGHTCLEELYRVIGDFGYINDLYDIVISQTVGRGVHLTEAELSRAEDMARDFRQVEPALKTVPTKEVINLIIALALKSDAGDLHIEPVEAGVKVRFRIDGVLHDIVTLPKESYLPLLGEIKILSGFVTNVKQATMDGRFTIFLKDSKVDCRVSIISGGYGETIVVRLLTTQASNLDMSTLGIESYTLEALHRSMKKTKGIIITTGPTGSGKTTTLYSILNQLNDPNVKIITVEDPIEYQLPGIMQTQINTEQGYTFAAAMRSLLRQNPNIMMIGEIRDAETANIAIEAALTGHLVLSTIHANSAAGSVSRFMGLGVSKQMLANAIECAIGQRLARKICPYCQKVEVIPDASQLMEIQNILASIKNPSVKVPTEIKFYRGAGCDKCGGLGYKGRIGFYEIIESSPVIQKAIQSEQSTDYDIEQVALSEGMVSMAQDGVLKALAGKTTLEEVFRVIK
jgi:type IV pilus assembly protein PilB